MRDGRLGPRRRRLGLAEGTDDAARARHCAVSEAAYAATGSTPRYYFDWERTRKAQQKHDAAFTPPVSLVSGLNVALGLLLEEGLEKRSSGTSASAAPRARA